MLPKYFHWSAGLVCFLALQQVGMAQGANPLPVPFSTGTTIVLEKALVPEKPTILLFWRKGSSMERDFARSIYETSKATSGFRSIALTTGNEAAAKQFSITQTPTAMVYDRRGRLLGRSDNPQAIVTLLEKALRVMRIDWAEEGTPLFAEAEKVMKGRGLKPGIMRTMSLKPRVMELIQTLHQEHHVKDGALDRRTKEMIATYVSALNRCKY